MNSIGQKWLSVCLCVLMVSSGVSMLAGAEQPTSLPPNNGIPFLKVTSLYSDTPLVYYDHDNRLTTTLANEGDGIALSEVVDVFDVVPSEDRKELITTLYLGALTPGKEKSRFIDWTPTSTGLHYIEYEITSTYKDSAMELITEATTFSMGFPVILVGNEEYWGPFGDLPSIISSSEGTRYKDGPLTIFVQDDLIIESGASLQLNSSVTLVMDNQELADYSINIEPNGKFIIQSLLMDTSIAKTLDPNPFLTYPIFNNGTINFIGANLYNIYGDKSDLTKMGGIQNFPGSTCILDNCNIIDSDTHSISAEGDAFVQITGDDCVIGSDIDPGVADVLYGHGIYSKGGAPHIEGVSVKYNRKDGIHIEDSRANGPIMADNLEEFESEIYDRLLPSVPYTIASTNPIVTVGDCVHATWIREEPNHFELDGRTIYGGTHLMYSRSTDEGLTWSQPISLLFNTNDPNLATYNFIPSSVDISSNGPYIGIVYAKHMGQTITTYNLLYSDSDGASWNENVTLASIGMSIEGRISIDWQDETGYIVYQAGRNLFDLYVGIAFKTFTDGTISEIEELFETEGTGRPKIAVDGNDVHIMFSDSEMNHEITYLRNIDDTGWTDTTLTTYSVNGIAFDSNSFDLAARDGQIILTWQSYDTVNHVYDIYCMMSSNQGETWSSDIQLTSSVGNSINPTCLIDSKLNMLVIWQNDRSGIENLRYSCVNELGFITLDDVELTAQGIAQSTNPSVAIDSSNKIFMLWKDGRTGSHKIYTKWTTHQLLVDNVIIESNHNGISVDDSTATLEGSQIHNNDKYGIVVNNTSNVIIKDNSFDNNEISVMSNESSPKLSGNTISNSVYGFYSETDIIFNIENNQFLNNEYGIYANKSQGEEGIINTLSDGETERTISIERGDSLTTGISVPQNSIITKAEFEIEYLDYVPDSPFIYDVFYIVNSNDAIELESIAKSLETNGISFAYQYNILLPRFESGDVLINEYNRVLVFDYPTSNSRIFHKCFITQYSVIVAFSHDYSVPNNGLFQDTSIYSENQLATTELLSMTIADIFTRSGTGNSDEYLFASTLINENGYLLQSATNDYGTSTSTSSTEFEIPVDDTVVQAWLRGRWVVSPTSYPDATTQWPEIVNQSITSYSQTTPLCITTHDSQYGGTAGGASLSIFVEGSTPPIETHSFSEQDLDLKDEVFITSLYKISNYSKHAYFSGLNTTTFKDVALDDSLTYNVPVGWDIEWLALYIDNITVDGVETTLGSLNVTAEHNSTEIRFENRSNSALFWNNMIDTSVSPLNFDISTSTNNVVVNLTFKISLTKTFPIAWHYLPSGYTVIVPLESPITINLTTPRLFVEVPNMNYGDLNSYIDETVQNMESIYVHEIGKYIVYNLSQNSIIGTIWGLNDENTNLHIDTNYYSEQIILKIGNDTEVNEYAVQSGIHITVSEHLTESLNKLIMKNDLKLECIPITAQISNTGTITISNINVQWKRCPIISNNKFQGGSISIEVHDYEICITENIINGSSSQGLLLINSSAWLHYNTISCSKEGLSSVNSILDLSQNTISFNKIGICVQDNDNQTSQGRINNNNISSNDIGILLNDCPAIDIPYLLRPLEIPYDVFHIAKSNDNINLVNLADSLTGSGINCYYGNVTIPKYLDNLDGVFLYEEDALIFNYPINPIISSIQHRCYVTTDSIVVAFSHNYGVSNNGLFQDSTTVSQNQMTTTELLDATIMDLFTRCSVGIPAKRIFASSLINNDGYLLQSATNDYGTSLPGTTSWTEFSIPSDNNVVKAWLRGNAYTASAMTYPTNTIEWSGPVNQSVIALSHTTPLKISTYDMNRWDTGGGASLMLITEGQTIPSEIHSFSEQELDLKDEVFISPLYQIQGARNLYLFIENNSLSNNISILGTNSSVYLTNNNISGQVTNIHLDNSTCLSEKNYLNSNEGNDIFCTNTSSIFVIDTNLNLARIDINDANSLINIYQNMRVAVLNETGKPKQSISVSIETFNENILYSDITDSNGMAKVKLVHVVNPSQEILPEFITAQDGSISHYSAHMDFVLSPNVYEIAIYIGQDTDNDGFTDGEERFVYFTEHSNNDTDEDGLLDGLELGLTYPHTDLTDISFFEMDAHPDSHTVPLSNDTDNDGLLDGEEDKNHNGFVDADESSPTNPDSDGDSIIDGNEIGWFADSDNDGLINALDTDSDNDGIPDNVEDANLNGVIDECEPSPVTHDSDNDGIGDGSMTTLLDITVLNIMGPSSYSLICHNNRFPVTDGTYYPSGSSIDETISVGYLQQDVYIQVTDETDAIVGEFFVSSTEPQLMTLSNNGIQLNLKVTSFEYPLSAIIDTDNDNMTDLREGIYLSTRVANFTLENTDGEGTINIYDPDSDNDGLLDGDEVSSASYYGTDNIPDLDIYPTNSHYLFAYESRVDAYDSFFMDSFNSEPCMEIITNGYAFSYKPLNIYSNGITIDTPTATSLVYNSHIQYADVYPYTNLEYDILPSKVKETYTITSSLHPLFGNNDVIFNGCFYYDSDNITTWTDGIQQFSNFQTDGPIEFKVNGVTIMQMDAPIASDSSGQTIQCTYDVSMSLDQIEIGITVLGAFMFDSVYPIYVDPTCSIPGDTAVALFNTQPLWLWYPAISHDFVWRDCNNQDVNGDGLADFIISTYGTGGIGETSIYVSTGSSFALYWTNPQFEYGRIMGKPYLRDIDGDGDTDVIIRNENNTNFKYLYVYLNSDGVISLTPNYVLPAPQENGCRSNIVFNDIDDDNDLDVLSFIDYDTGTSLWKTFQVHQWTASGYSLYYTYTVINVLEEGFASIHQLVDFNNDGVDDISIKRGGSPYSRTEVWLNNNGVFNPNNPFYIGDYDISQWVDFNLDGYMDIFKTAYKSGYPYNALVKFYYNSHSNPYTFSYVREFYPDTYYDFNHFSGWTFGDVDNDGDQDLLIGVNNNVYGAYGTFKLFTNSNGIIQSTPKWERTCVLSGDLPEAGQEFLWGDFNGDQYLDFMCIISAYIDYPTHSITVKYATYMNRFLDYDIPPIYNISIKEIIKTSETSLTVVWTKYWGPNFAKYEVYTSFWPLTRLTADYLKSSIDNIDATFYEAEYLPYYNKMYIYVRVINIFGVPGNTACAIYGVETPLPYEEYPPVAIVTQTPIFRTNKVVLDGSTSYDPNTQGSIVSCEWEFLPLMSIDSNGVPISWDYSPIMDLGKVNTPTIIVDITQTGTYLFKFTVTNNYGLSDDEFICIGQGDYYDGSSDPLNEDSDGDGLTDGEEANLGTDKNDSDTDGDGLTDWEEVFVWHTSAQFWDSEIININNDRIDDFSDPLPLINNLPFQVISIKASGESFEWREAIWIELAAYDYNNIVIEVHDFTFLMGPYNPVRYVTNYGTGDWYISWDLPSSYWNSYHYHRMLGYTITMYDLVTGYSIDYTLFFGALTVEPMIIQCKVTMAYFTTLMAATITGGPGGLPFTGFIGEITMGVVADEVGQYALEMDFTSRTGETVPYRTELSLDSTTEIFIDSQGTTLYLKEGFIESIEYNAITYTRGYGRLYIQATNSVNSDLITEILQYGTINSNFEDGNFYRIYQYSTGTETYKLIVGNGVMGIYDNIILRIEIC